MSITTQGEITIDSSVKGRGDYIVLADLTGTLLTPEDSREDGSNAEMHLISIVDCWLPKGDHDFEDLRVDKVVVLNSDGDEEPNEYEYFINRSGITIALHVSSFGDESPRKIRREIENSIDLRQLGVVYNDQIEFGDILHMEVSDFIEAFR